jgi:HK97 family phage major capsid protein
MVGFPEIKSAIDKMGEAQDVFVKSQRERLDGFQKGIDGLTDRIEGIEAKANTPGRTGDPGETKESREHIALFKSWLRAPKNPETNRKLSEFEMNRKAASIATPASGGYAVPEEISSDIAQMQLKYSPVRNLVRISRASTSDMKRLVDLTGAEGGWRSESGSVSETNTPVLREIAPTGGELYAYPKTSNWLLEDALFDVRAWLTESASKRFAQLEGQAVLSGDGSSKPTGMLHTSPVTTADQASPLRAAAAYQYLACVSTSSPPVAEILPDKLIDVVYSLNSAYRTGAAWAMNSTTAGSVRKLKDSQGRYLWTDSLVAGQPAQLLGYPVAAWEDMDDVGTNKLPIAFGNFSEGYELIDRSDLRITVDEVTTPGQTKFYMRKRVYGHVRNNDAVKFLKTTLS